MGKREKAVLAVLFVALAVSLVVPVKGLWIDGVYAWHIRQPEFKQMMVEIAVIILLLGGIWLCLPTRFLKLCLTGLLCLAFIWCHVVFLPMLISGLYFGYLCLLGMCLRVRLLKQTVKHFLFADFLLGSCSIITLFCLLSAVGIASMPVLKSYVILSAIPVCVVSVIERNQWHTGRRKSSAKPWGKAERLLLVLIITMLLIQIGRMNISVDFDSLWYGVRSEYMLNPGHGIYENPGTVGLVYTYSKGMEVLLLPLSDWSSHSYLISFNVWMAVLALLAVYQIARYYMTRGYALFAVAAVSTIPAIMNMSITAKTDSMTLAVQMIMVLYLLAYLRDHQVKHLLVSVSALFLSWTLKPTAIVFSTAVFGMSFLYLVITRQFSLKATGKQWLLLIPSLTALAGIWARTVLIVGIPVTSVFSSILLKLGFEMKYPFAELPLYGSSTGGESMLFYLGRTITEMLLYPVGENMSHVVFAWGTSLMFFLPIMAVLVLRLKKRSLVADTNQIRYAHTVMIPFAAVCLVSLAMLGQIDGNYFMLFYVFVILYGFAMLSRVSQSVPKHMICMMLVPLLLFNLIMTAVSNWSWSLGFTPIQIENRGSYDHEQKQKEAMIQSGNEKIWEILSADPQTRVIAAGKHPEVFAFPCMVQSYDDITSSWGNVALVKTMDAFIEYLEYAQTDYVYMQGGAVEAGTRCYELMGYLIEAGILTDVIYENGNLLASVDLDGAYGAEASLAYEEYFKRYQMTG